MPREGDRAAKKLWLRCIQGSVSPSLDACEGIFAEQREAIDDSECSDRQNGIAQDISTNPNEQTAEAEAVAITHHSRNILFSSIGAHGSPLKTVRKLRSRLKTGTKHPCTSNEVTEAAAAGIGAPARNVAEAVCILASNYATTSGGKNVFNLHNTQTAVPCT